MTIVHIEDCAPIGSSRVDAVGVFRAQSGSQPLVLEEDDSVLFRLYFGSGGGVLLLIQPDSHRAAFFLPAEGGGFAPGQPPEYEFSFPASRMQNAPPARRLKNGLRAIVAAAALLVGTVGGAAMVYFKDKPASNQPAPLQMPSPAKPAAKLGTPKAQALRLNVQRQDQVLRLRWDPNAAAVRSATRGVMYISDGSQQTQLDLNTAELSSGLLSYWPETENVQFRLELFLRDETKTFVDAKAARSDSPEPAIQQRPAAPVARPGPAHHGEVRPSPFVPTPVVNVPAVHRLTPEGPLKTEVAPKPDGAMKAEEAPRPDSAPKAAAAGPLLAPDVTVAAEPLGGPRWGRVVGRIPLVRRLRRHPQDFVPPEPLHRVLPLLNARTKASSELSDVKTVDVKIHVTEDGKVQSAELVSNGMGRRHDLGGATGFAEAAVGAARRWEFLPAHVGQENVPGDVVLHFRFNP